MSTSSLFRLSALAALISGLCMIVEDLLTLLFGYTAVGSIIWLFAPMLGLFAFTGIYLWQREQAGALGGIGYIVVSFGLALGVGVNYALAFIIPHLGENVVEGLMSGAIGMAFLVSVLIYLAGVILFGISVIVARVFSWVPALLLMIGFVPITLSAFMPDIVIHIGGFVAGVGIFWFGVSLWSFSAKRAD